MKGKMEAGAVALLLALLSLSAGAYAQKAGDLVYTDVESGLEQGRFVLLGQGWSGGHGEMLYSRFPAEMKDKVRREVWELGRDAAGVAVRFRTDAQCIGARWELLYNGGMSHFAATGVKGMDLYTYYPDSGSWEFIGTAKPNGKVSSNVFLRQMDGQWRDYIAYLPLYDGVVKLEIGVEEGAEIAAPREGGLLPSPQRKPIVFYGTSITQGGCASRPGMAYTNILGRHMDREMINLGFSGNGRMDAAMADFIAGIDAEAVVVDCMANCTWEILRDSSAYFLRTIAQADPERTVYMASCYAFPYQHAQESVRRDLADGNALWKAIYLRLRKEGLANLRFLNLSGGKITPQKGEERISRDPECRKKDFGGNMSKSATGPDNEGTVDGVHLTDMGFARLAAFLQKELKKHR